MTVTAAQVVFSYLLIVGLAAGIIAFVCASLAPFQRWRRGLLIAGLIGFICFTWGLLALTQPHLRLYVLYYWLFTAAIIGGGIGTVTMRNVFHAALMLILALFGVAGYFILVNAEFLAMVQVIIYIGGIMVLFLFGIMVSQNIIGSEIKQNTPQAPWAAAAVTVFFLFMLFVGLFMSLPRQQTATDPVLTDNTQSVGWALMATFTLPFEVASVLLLMAMLGAIVLVRKD